MNSGQCLSENCESISCNTVHTSNIGSTISFRPKSSLARALYEKQKHDEFLEQFDKNEWYQCDLSSLPTSLSATFVQLNPDQDTINFLEQSEKKSDWIFTQLWHSVVKLFLGWFVTQTSINGYLASGDSMISVSYAFRIAHNTVSKIIKETCDVIWECLNSYVLLEPSEKPWLHIAQDFQQKWQFPHCAGAIDGKHIIIQAPPKAGSTYYNYKGTHSIVLLALCDANYKFTLVDIGSEGRHSDGGIFENSSIGKRLISNDLNFPASSELGQLKEPINYFICADEAFPVSTSIMRPYAGRFLPQTKRIFNYRWLQRGSMFVLSQPQFRKLLRVDQDWRSATFIDLGAGDGEVTAHIAPLFDTIYATEVSSTMRALLKKRGYELLEIDTWHLQKKYDFISCLNVIDRCDTPFELLSNIRNALKPDGRVLLAVVLPFSAYVESGTADHKPLELLEVNGSNFEDQVKSFVENIFIPANFEVVSWSRVPYLCEGDLQQSYYWLDDAIFVLKLKTPK